MTATPDGRPTCRSCGTTYPLRRTMTPSGPDPRRDGWGIRDLTAQEYEQRARTRGWHLHTGTTLGGVTFNDALCPRCARPDPAVVRLCRDLRDSVGGQP